MPLRSDVAIRSLRTAIGENCRWCKIKAGSITRLQIVTGCAISRTCKLGLPASDTSTIDLLYATCGSSTTTRSNCPDVPEQNALFTSMISEHITMNYSRFFPLGIIWIDAALKSILRYLLFPIFRCSNTFWRCILCINRGNTVSRVYPKYAHNQ